MYSWHVLEKKKKNKTICISLPYMSMNYCFWFLKHVFWLLDIIYNVASTNCTNLFLSQKCSMRFLRIVDVIFFTFKFLMKFRK